MIKLTLHYYRFHQEKQVEPIAPAVIPYHDLTMVLEGALEYRINGRLVRVKEGAVILLPPGTKRERLRTEGKTTYVSFNFVTDDSLELPTLIEDAVSKEIRMMVYALNELELGRDNYSRAAFEDVTSAILNVLRAHVARSGYSELTESILSYIHENYKSFLPLRKIAAAMNYSVAYCDQVFKRDIGVSIVHYLIDYRIAKVKEYLIENVISLKEIAEQTGFGECNYLSRQFRQRTGLSPLRFRKQLGH